MSSRIVRAPHFAAKKTTAARTGTVWPLGLLIWDTDLSELFVGDGSTAGGVAIAGGGASPDFSVGVYTSASALSIQGAFTFHASQNGNITNYALGTIPAGKAVDEVILTWSRTTVNLTADIDLAAGFMAPGDGFMGREVADTSSTYSFDTAFQIEQEDVAALYATALSGDHITLEITNNSGSGTLRLYGVSVSFI